jgi:hypothetical protein
VRIRIRARLLVTAPLAVALAAGSLTMAGSAAGSVAGAGHRARAAASVTAARAGGRRTGLAAGNPFCKKLGVRYQASSGAQAFCFGAQRTGTVGHSPAAGPRAAGSTPANVNAASFAEDISPTGVRGYGQSEVSIAASGKYVVEAWNDSTGFFASCGAPLFKEETTGLGFSANGGKSFTDLGGLPNPGCANNLFEGDPSVAAYKVGGSTYFYISSLYDSPLGTGNSMIAMDACKVTGSGQRATLACSRPIALASSTFCKKFPNGPGQTVTFCNFLDKDFLTVDPVHHRLYATFTEFPMNVGGAGSRIELAVCDLGNALGGSGPAGGTPGSPFCENNKAGKHGYLIVVPADATGCENEGAYPAVDPVTGDVYIGYESNWATSIEGFAPCNTTPVSDVMTTVPASCLPLAAHASCGATAAAGVPVVSLQSAFIPGYSRFPASDFPRVAVSDPAGTVSMVWNDTRYHPEGDILLQSFNLGSLAGVQNVPVVVDKPIAGALNFLPGLRGADASGNLDISWYSRRSVNTSNTNVYAAIGIHPRTTTAPTSNILITSRASNWDNSVWDANPNFGDYTDNDIAVTGTAPYIGSTLYIAWSDGTTGVPQPFEAHLPG